MMIEATALSKTYGGRTALDGLSFGVERGEVLGFLGPNGAGKSTTVKILAGMTKPSSGRATVAGYDVGVSPEEVKKRVGYVPETGALYETLTPGEFLDFVGSLHRLEPSTARARAEELLELFALVDVRDTRLFELSKGTRQKVILGAALIHDPEVLLLDEPLNFLDANAAILVKDLLRTLSARGRAILFCSHVLDVVERTCTRVLVIHEGRKVAEGTPADLLRATGASSIDEAFSSLTRGGRPTRDAPGFLSAREDR
jgi:ABC-2 type transport system ATP-binding protein